MDKTLKELISKSNKESAENKLVTLIKDIVKDTTYDRVFIGDMFVNTLGNVDIHESIYPYLKNIYPCDAYDILKQQLIEKTMMVENIIYGSIGYELFRMYMAIPAYHKYVNNLIRKHTKVKDIIDIYDNEGKMIIDKEKVYNMLPEYNCTSKRIEEYISYITNENVSIDEEIHKDILLIALSTFVVDIAINKDTINITFNIHPEVFKNTTILNKDMLFGKDGYIKAIVYVLLKSEIYYIHPLKNIITYEKENNSFTVTRNINTQRKQRQYNSGRTNRIYHCHIFSDERCIKNLQKKTIAGMISRANIFVNKELINSTQVYKDIYIYNEFRKDINEEDISSFEDKRIYYV